MLRGLVLALILANAVFFGWRHGWLDGLAGVSPHGDRDPGRLAFQIQPERIRVVPGPVGDPPRADAALPTCLEIGPYTLAQRAAAEAALLPVVPQGRIAEVKVETADAPVTYMLRIDGVTLPLRAQLTALRSPALGERSFSPCR